MGKLDFPQGLKPNVYKVLSDTAEAVPFQNRFMKPALANCYSCLYYRLLKVTKMFTNLL